MGGWARASGPTARTRYSVLDRVNPRNKVFQEDGAPAAVGVHPQPRVATQTPNEHVSLGLLIHQHGEVRILLHAHLPARSAVGHHRRCVRVREGEDSCSVTSADRCCSLVARVPGSLVRATFRVQAAPENPVHPNLRVFVSRCVKQPGKTAIITTYHRLSVCGPHRALVEPPAHLPAAGCGRSEA